MSQFGSHVILSQERNPIITLRIDYEKKRILDTSIYDSERGPYMRRIFDNKIDPIN